MNAILEHQRDRKAEIKHEIQREINAGKAYSNTPILKAIFRNIEELVEGL